MKPTDFPATLTLVGISVLVYLLMNTGNQEAVLRPLLISEYYQPVLPEVFSGQIWRLITPMFLHFGIFHIVFNMVWVWQLGRIIEFKQGWLPLLVVVIVSGIASNLGQYFVSGPVFGGMSGVVYALFGYVWIQGLTNPGFRIRLNPAIVYLMLGWFFICWTGLLEKLLGLHVANTAHTAGLAAGLLLSFAFSLWLRRGRFV